MEGQSITDDEAELIARFDAPGQEFRIEREPRWTGGQFTNTGKHTSLAAAVDWYKSLRRGSIDNYLNSAWYLIIVNRSRDANGRFERGYTITMLCRRPAKGEPYELEDPESEMQSDPEIG